MLTVYSRSNLLAALGRPPRRAVIAIGNFDGVHRGHQALLATARQAAGMDGDVIALTFDPHPARFFAPAASPPLIMSLARRIELLGESGADIVVVEPFTAELAAMEAETFVHRALVLDLAASHVVVGYDFSFGRGRRGSAETMKTLASEVGVRVSVVSRVSVHGVTCSSTKIRQFVLEGQVEGAEILLGRPYELRGIVVRGAARGRAIGFPTANLRVDTELLPKPGIYAARAHTAAGAGDTTADGKWGAAVDATKDVARWPCALSIGTNPTFTSDGALTVEAHLLDFSGDLYDRNMRIELVQRLRDEWRFESVEALVDQIRRDVTQTRDVLGS